MTLRARTCLLAISLAAVSCTPPAPQRPAAPALDPGPIRPPSSLGFDFQWRQRVTATWPTGKQSFDAVLQKRNGELLLLGLSPLGVPGFVLTLRANGLIDVQNRTGRALPFEPAYILADVERVFFPWLEPVQNPAAPRSGQSWGLTIDETYSAGRLQTRTFHRPEKEATGSVRIAYAGWQPGRDAPARVTVANDWFRYGLEIETIEQTRLPAASE